MLNEAEYGRLWRQEAERAKARLTERDGASIRIAGSVVGGQRHRVSTTDKWLAMREGGMAYVDIAKVARRDVSVVRKGIETARRRRRKMKQGESK